MWTSTFWIQVGERAIKTFAQAMAALIAGDNLGVLDVNWESALSIAALTTLASVLSSIASVPVGPGDSPSLK